MRFKVVEIEAKENRQLPNQQENGFSANSVFTKQKNQQLYQVNTEEIIALENDEEIIEEMKIEELAKEDIKCRFCWCYEVCEEDPLLKVCKCKGSVGFIHLSCLKSWLATKKNEKVNPFYSSYYWKNFECELCKS